MYLISYKTYRQVKEYYGRKEQLRYSFGQDHEQKAKELIENLINILQPVERALSAPVQILLLFHSFPYH